MLLDGTSMRHCGRVWDQDDVNKGGRHSWVSPRAFSQSVVVRLGDGPWSSRERSMVGFLTLVLMEALKPGGGHERIRALPDEGAQDMPSAMVLVFTPQEPKTEPMTITCISYPPHPLHTIIFWLLSGVLPSPFLLDTSSLPFGLWLVCYCL